MNEQRPVAFDQQSNDIGRDAAVISPFVHVDGKLDEERMAVFGERDELVFLAGGRKDRHSGLRLRAERSRRLLLRHVG